MRTSFYRFLKDISKDKRWLTISNMLTLTRLILVPFIVYGMIMSQWRFVFVLFVGAIMTDLLDGHIARVYNERTRFGAYLDPIADKVLLISCFATLAFVDSPSLSVPRWFVFFVLFREFVILGGSCVLLQIGVKLQIKPTIWGKLTTFFQSIFIVWIFVCYFVGWNPEKTYSVVIVLLTVFSLLSLAQYARIGLGYVQRK